MAKPKKNRFWCIESKQFKQRFESKEKAMSFIEWNRDSFKKNYRPVRAYFCEACGCWHITHLAKPRRKNSLTEEVIERMKKEEKGLLGNAKNITLASPKKRLKRLRRDLDYTLFENNGEISKEQLDSIWTRYNTIKKEVSEYSAHVKYLDLFFWEKGYIEEKPVKESTEDILCRIKYNLLHGIYHPKDASDFLRMKAEKAESEIMKEIEKLYKKAIAEKAF